MRSLIYTIAFSLLLSTSLGAGAFALSGVGSEGLTLAGSNITSPSGWSALYWNPAALTSKSENQIGITLNYLRLKGRYVMRTGLIGYDGGYRKQDTTVSPDLYFPIPAFGIKRSMGRISIGFSGFTPFGLGTKWKLYKFPLGYFNTNDTTFKIPELPEYDWTSDLKTFGIYAGIGYRISDRFSIGLAGGMFTANIKLTRIELMDPAKFDTMAKQMPVQYRLIPVYVEVSGSDVKPAFNLGMIYKPSEKIKLGLVARYYPVLHFSGDAYMKIYYPRNDTIAAYMDSTARYMMSGMTAEISGTLKDATFKLPYEVGLGMGYELNKKNKIYFSFLYTFWSRFDVVPIEFENMKMGEDQEIKADTLYQNYTDGIRIAFGFNHKFTNRLELNSGIYFDKTPIPDTAITPLIPDVNNKFSINLGIGYNFNAGLKLNLGFEIFYMPEKRVEPQEGYSPESDNMPGDYKINIGGINASIVYSF